MQTPTNLPVYQGNNVIRRPVINQKILSQMREYRTLAIVAEMDYTLAQIICIRWLYISLEFAPSKISTWKHALALYVYHSFQNGQQTNNEKWMQTMLPLWTKNHKPYPTPLPSDRNLLLELPDNSS